MLQPALLPKFVMWDEAGAGKLEGPCVPGRVYSFPGTGGLKDKVWREHVSVRATLDLTANPYSAAKVEANTCGKVPALAKVIPPELLPTLSSVLGHSSVWEQLHSLHFQLELSLMVIPPLSEPQDPSEGHLSPLSWPHPSPPCHANPTTESQNIPSCKQTTWITEVQHIPPPWTMGDFPYLPAAVATCLQCELSHGDGAIPPSSHGKWVSEESLASHSHSALPAPSAAAARRKCQGLSGLAWGVSEIYLHGLIDSK